MMSLPPPGANQPYCTVSALKAGTLSLDYATFIDNAAPGEIHRVPSLSFLLHHSVNKKRLIFDLGIRKDWENLPPSVLRWNKDFLIEVEQDVVESLAKGGLTPSDIDTVCLSHIHFDHHGHAPSFPQSEFVVGGDTIKFIESRGFYSESQNPESTFTKDILPMKNTRFLDEDTKWDRVGPFPRAYDFYGDGSLYIVDAPGHAPGHVNILARTSADGAWIYLAADSAHHLNLITGKSHIACGPDGCAHMSKELAEDTIKRIREVMAMPKVRVMIAHDKAWYDDNKDGPAFLPGIIPSL